MCVLFCFISFYFLFLFLSFYNILPFLLASSIESLVLFFFYFILFIYLFHFYCPLTKTKSSSRLKPISSFSILSLDLVAFVSALRYRLAASCQTLHIWKDNITDRIFANFWCWLFDSVPVIDKGARLCPAHSDRTDGFAPFRYNFSTLFRHFSVRCEISGRLAAVMNIPAFIFSSFFATFRLTFPLSQQVKTNYCKIDRSSPLKGISKTCSLPSISLLAPPPSLRLLHLFIPAASLSPPLSVRSHRFCLRFWFDRGRGWGDGGRTEKKGRREQL